ncbi:hypothetical protein CTEN210_04979 [Chaetoceros tenuissimus]|uniref:Uncharacterized protein n=1 Tax=Chaetoceros tenuissimus TaxID=426638 RepID=A0AAD3CM82_9STRA|nr:hypothetical protein CTEN210_04979 [Chaetoceros tenuissimus]
MHTFFNNCSHSFKSKSINSKRSRKNAQCINKPKISFKTKNQLRRFNKRCRKLNLSLNHYHPEPLKEEIRDALNNKEPVVFAGGDLNEIPDKIQGKKVTKFRVSELEIIDDTNGFSLHNEKGHVIATLVPREKALLDRPKDIFEALNLCLQKANPKYTRGGTRLVGVKNKDDGAEAYFCRGWTPCRNKKGNYEKWMEHEKKVPGLVERIQKLIRFNDNKAQGYIHPMHLKGFKMAEKKGFSDFVNACSPDANPEELIKQGQVLVSIAVGVGSYLNAHKDDDAFVSVITSLAEDEDHYKEEADIVTYFCFPDQGRAIALRAGDILVFNSADELHCSSSNSEAFSNETVFNCSMYLKTNVLAGNNNEK